MKQKKNRVFDWSKAELEHVLVKFAYVGTNYYGLASQTTVENSTTVSSDNNKCNTEKVLESDANESANLIEDKSSSINSAPPTVEDEIFKALDRTTLCQSRSELLKNYSRCGRTDKGVHAAGNYFSAMLRKVQRSSNSHTSESEDPRIKMINGCLPHDIRVTHIWILPKQCTPEKFSARYSCLYRVYKYYFVNHKTEKSCGNFKMKYDLDRINDAAKLLIGEHDFRNFCKMDLSQTTNFVRRILSVKVSGHTQNHMESESLVEVEIRGLSFLWHQIRCIMSVLFLIGEGKEDSSIISELLDRSQFHKGKPNYDLADESGLVLYDCAFEIPPSSAVSNLAEESNIDSIESTETKNKSSIDFDHKCQIHDTARHKIDKFESESKTILTLNQGRTGLFQNLQRKAFTRAGILACLDGSIGPESDKNYENQKNQNQKYVPLLKRARAPPLEEKLKTYNAKLKKKSDSLENLESEYKRENMSEVYNDKDGERLAKIRKIEDGT